MISISIDGVVIFSDACTNAIDLLQITPPYIGTAFGAKSTHNPTCRGIDIPDRIFHIIVSKGHALTIEIDGSESLKEIRYGGACPGETLIACGDAVTETWVNNQSQEVEVYLLIADLSHGDFFLSWNIGNFYMAFNVLSKQKTSMNRTAKKYSIKLQL